MSLETKIFKLVLSAASFGIAVYAHESLKDENIIMQIIPQYAFGIGGAVFLVSAFYDQSSRKKDKDQR